MKQAMHAVGATLVIAAGVAIVGYLAVPPFREAVNDFARRFKGDMDERETELINALSSTEEEIGSARAVWEGRKRRNNPRIDDADDDLNFE